jgi:two-component system, chemotaxis family, protein-glutamate methylesterase/glutaminase
VMRKLRVLIVEDSAVVREFLTHIINEDPGLEVAAAVSSGEEALRVLDRAAPDVISMDIQLPGMDGLETTRNIMARRPTPIVVISASVQASDVESTMNALRAGALAVVEKPVGLSSSGYEASAAKIRTQLRIMSEVRVVRQRLPTGAAPAAPPLPPRPARGGSYEVLAIAASTGGPNALARVIGGLPPGFRLPVLVVQHMTASFLDGFATWLGTVCKLPVELGTVGTSVLPGRVYVAPGDRHLIVNGGRLALDPGPLVSGQRPSGTVLFRSVARAYGSGALGVILTGMGDDGAEGLREIRAAGGYTLAEDSSTCVVYGMPAAAVQVGAVAESLPLDEIAPRVLALAGREAR